MNIRSIPTNRVQAPRLATCQARLAGFPEVHEPKAPAVAREQNGGARESVTTLLLYATALEAALGSPPSGRALPPSHEVYPLSNIPDRVAALTWRGLDDAIPRWVCANAVLRLFLCGRNRYQEPGVVRLE